MRSVYDNVAVGALVAQYSSVNGVITTSPSVDTKGYNSAALRVSLTPVISTNIVTGQGGTIAVVLQESNDNSTFTTATDNTGATIGGTVTSTTSAVLSSFRIEGLGQNRKRYLRTQLTCNFGVTLSTVAQGYFTTTAVIELGRAYTNPVTQTTSNT